MKHSIYQLHIWGTNIYLYLNATSSKVFGVDIYFQDQCRNKNYELTGNPTDICYYQYLIRISCHIVLKKIEGPLPPLKDKLNICDSQK